MILNNSNLPTFDGRLQVAQQTFAEQTPLESS